MPGILKITENATWFKIFMNEQSFCQYGNLLFCQKYLRRNYYMKIRSDISIQYKFVEIFRDGSNRTGEIGFDSSIIICASNLYDFTNGTMIQGNISESLVPNNYNWYIH